METNIDKLHKVDLEIVKQVKDICDQYGLKYYMIGGTMLGAIRHKGFIPWDDDVDLGLPRKDYEKFLDIAPKFLSNNLEIVNYKTNPEYQYYITRIRDKETKVIETRINNKNKYTHASIDIFPLDGSPNNIILRKIYYFRVMFWRAMMSMCYKDSIDPDRKRGKHERLLIKILKCIPIEKIFKPNFIKNRIDNLMRKNDFYKSKIVGCLMGAYRTKEMAPQKFYDEGEIYQFDNLKLRGPKEYDKFLTLIYGDYMKLPPIEQRKIHFKIIEIKGQKILD